MSPYREQAVAPTLAVDEHIDAQKWRQAHITISQSWPLNGEPVPGRRRHRRNCTNYLHWQVKRRVTELPAKSRYAPKDWSGRVSTFHNDHGPAGTHPFRAGFRTIRVAGVPLRCFEMKAFR